MAKVNDPLGLAAPILLTAKVIFWDICDSKLRWDADLPEELKRRWENWLKKLTSSFKDAKSNTQRNWSDYRIDSSRICQRKPSWLLCCDLFSCQANWSDKSRVPNF